MATRRERVYAMGRRRRATLIGIGVIGAALLVWADRGVFVSRRLARSEANGGTGARDVARYHGKSFFVTRVVDGDTLDLDAPDGEQFVTTVRLLGIDAPEAGSHDGPPMFYSRQATDAARKRVRGVTVIVYLEQAGRTRGRYGRLLAYIEMPDGRFLNEVLISEGCAYADRRFRHSYYQKYRQLESSARSLQKGLWRQVSREQLPTWLQRVEPDLLKP